MENYVMTKQKNIVGELIEAINNNAGEHPNANVRLQNLLDAVLPVMDRHKVAADDADYFLYSTGLISESQQESIILTMQEVEADREDASFEYMEDYGDHGDDDHSYEKQYYQNPAGKCEDAPCCGCCGMM
jgi:hypothetical protein